jgi:hypothetical protein
MKIITRETMLEEKFRNSFSKKAMVFKGSAEQNRQSRTGEPETYVDEVVKMKAPRWENSEGYHQLWNEIGKSQYKLKNTATAPTAAELEALLGKIFIDITKRAIESPDLTPQIATEVTNLGFAETVNLREIYPYRGKFAEISGANDSVPLIEQALGETDSVDMTIRALGWKDSLKNMLYNTLHNMQKVNQAVADAYTDYRNSLTAGVLIDATYVASQKQAASSTSGATDDVLMYETIKAAYKKLRGLKDIRTDRKIPVPAVSILCNSADRWDIERVIRGQLQTGGANGTLTTQNVSALPIANLIEYDQGITDGFSWGKETLSFDGVTAGKCYMFVPREAFWVLNKRPLTLETSQGTALQLSTQESAWYAVQAEYDKVFLGSSYPGTAVGAGYGYVIEVTLP